MKKVYGILAIIVFIPLIMLADSAKTLFDRANEYYAKGEYEMTVSLCDSMIKNNVESAAIYYNLGNAWFKLDDVPKAIYYYEKAKKLEPNNEDINYNLKIANTKIADRIEAVPEFFLKTWWNKLVYSLNEEQWTSLNIGIFAIFLVFIIIFFISKNPNTKKTSFIISIIFLVLSFLSGIIGFKSYKLKTTHNTAIIFTPTVNVKSAPDEGSSTLFILHQGSKVKLMEGTSTWEKIKIANGSEGWVLKEDFKKI
jgi:tetratricopeptide (TPR) repeat protein